MDIFLPADRFETEKLIRELVKYDKPAYIRIGRNPVDDVYESTDFDFEIGKANVMREGKDITIIATGETVKPAMKHQMNLKN